MSPGTVQRPTAGTKTILGARTVYPSARVFIYIAVTYTALVAGKTLVGLQQQPEYRLLVVVVSCCIYSMSLLPSPLLHDLAAVTTQPCAPADSTDPSQRIIECKLPADSRAALTFRIAGMAMYAIERQRRCSKCRFLRKYNLVVRPRHPFPR